MHPFALDDTYLASLAPDKAVDFFRRLLWNEARATGIGLNLVSVSSNINEADGGLDGRIENATPSREDLIPSGFSGFQIKTSKFGPKDCKLELHRNRNPNGPLKEGIQEILERNGTYILVLFTKDSDKKKKSKIDALRAEFSKIGYPNAQFRLYTADQLASFASVFPSFNLQKQGLPHQVWADHRNIKIPATFVPDEHRANVLRDIRARLRPGEKHKNPLRLIGLSGLGKTRLIFEALNVDDLKNQVIYIDAAQFQGSELLRELQNEKNLNAIVVVDDCPLEFHQKFWNQLSDGTGRIALITLSNEIKGIDGPESFYLLEQLSKDSIKKILANEIPELNASEIDILAEIIDGFPLLVKLYADYYSEHKDLPNDLILAINDEVFIERLIGGGSTEKSWQITTKKVLQGIALFTRIGFEDPVDDEAKSLCKSLGLNWTDFEEVVQEQRQRGLIKGKHYITISAFPLAAYLKRDWFANLRKDAYDHLIDGFAPNKRQEMMGRFNDNFPYGTSTLQGKRLVKQLLSPQGFFKDGAALKTQTGASLFLKLAEADPKSALDCLKSTLGTWSNDALLQFQTGRREVVWALEKIGIWKECFSDAARLLLALAEAENETYANNATGVFSDLFSPAPGLAAPTEASPEERIPILFEAIKSPSLKRQKVALNAFRTALELSHIGWLSVEKQGTKRPPKMWEPKSTEEMLRYRSTIWEYLETHIDQFDEQIKFEALDVIFSSARGIASIPQLNEKVRLTLVKLSSLPWVNKEEVIRVISEILVFDSDKMTREIGRTWQQTKETLIGSSFSDTIKRYVKMDLKEDYLHNGRYDEGWMKQKVQEIAAVIIVHPEYLEAEYDWLISSDNKRVYTFGRELGLLDSDFSLLPALSSAYKYSKKSQNANFLGGYFRAMFERNPQKWEDELDLLAKDFFFKYLIPELTSLSGISDRSAERIVALVKNGEVEARHLGALLRRDITGLLESTVIHAIDVTLERMPFDGAYLALLLLYHYYVIGNKGILPRDVAISVLLNDFFWKNAGIETHKTRIDYDWFEIASRLSRENPEIDELLSHTILANFGNEESLAGIYDSQVFTFLYATIERKPSTMWATITSYLGPPIDRRAYNLKEWLKGERGFKTSGPSALRLLNPGDIWAWIEADVQKRAWYFATFVDPCINPEDKRSSLARELLIRYGNREDVRNNFAANYSSDVFWGSLREKFEKRKERLLKIKEREENVNIIKWIEEYVSALDRDIEREKIREERGDFG
jgi:hypothetical protein